MRSSILAAIVLLVSICALQAQGRAGTPAPKLYSVRGTVKVGQNPAGILTAAGGILVANFGGSTLSRVDVSSLKLKSPINVGRGPYGLARMSRHEDKSAVHVYITNQRDNTVSIFDEYADKVIATIPVGRVPHGVATTVPATSKAYVANAGDNSVTVINQRTLRPVTTITKGIGSFPTAVAARWNALTMRSYVFVANTGSSTISVIDSSTDTVVSTVSTFTNYPIGAAAIQSIPRAFITNQRINTVAEIDSITHKVLSTVAVGAQPIGVGVKYPTGDVNNTRFDLFVANSADNTVSVLRRDLRDNSQQTQTLRVGKGPFGVDTSGTHVCVSNYQDGTVTVIH